MVDTKQTKGKQMDEGDRNRLEFKDGCVAMQDLPDLNAWRSLVMCSPMEWELQAFALSCTGPMTRTEGKSVGQGSENRS